MDLLSSAWDWVSKKRNQATLAIIFSIFSGLAAAIAAAWTVYLRFSKKPKESSTVTASGGGIAAGGNVSPTASSGGIAVVSTAPVTIGITLQQYEAGLKRREQEIRGELAQANVTGKENRPLLEKQLSDIQAKLGNSEAALEDYKSKLAQAYHALDDLKKELLPEPLEQARVALQKGKTSDAEALFLKVLSGARRKPLRPLIS
jgi:ABC-type transporter Mla subunit MlaD